MITHSSTLAWEIPQTEEPGGLQSMGLQRVEHGLRPKHVCVCVCVCILWQNIMENSENGKYSFLFYIVLVYSSVCYIVLWVLTRSVAHCCIAGPCGLPILHIIVCIQDPSWGEGPWRLQSKQPCESDSRVGISTLDQAEAFAYVNTSATRDSSSRPLGLLEPGSKVGS